MGKLAVIGTFYRRYERTDMLLQRVLLESTRPPDEFFMVCEEEADAELAFEWARRYPNLILKLLPTPRTPSGGYSIVPYSNKINWALDNTTCDYIVYLDNNSMPHPEKYRLMSEALEHLTAAYLRAMAENAELSFKLEKLMEEKLIKACTKH